MGLRLQYKSFSLSALFNMVFCLYLRHTFCMLRIYFIPSFCLLDVLTVGEVDCTKYAAVCQKQGVSGYPTVLLFKDGEQLPEYEASRTFDG